MSWDGDLKAHSPCGASGGRLDDRCGERAEELRVRVVTLSRGRAHGAAAEGVGGLGGGADEARLRRAIKDALCRA